MPTSHYFKNYPSKVSPEQNLVENMIAESIKIMGMNVYFIPKESRDDIIDQVFGERKDLTYNRAYMIDVWPETTLQFAGPGNTFTNMGDEIRDNATFVVARKTFERYVPGAVRARPQEGDLLFVPTMKALFEIKFAEEEKEFFTRGKRHPYTYYLSCERYRYSNENLETGVPEIDEIENSIAYTIQLTLGSGTGSYKIDETVYQGNTFSNASVTAKVTDWDISTKKLNVININGVFANTVAVKGVTSNASYILTGKDEMGDYVYEDEFSNKEFQTDVDLIIDTTEVNPFGTP